MADVLYSYAYDTSNEKIKNKVENEVKVEDKDKDKEDNCKLYPIYPCNLTHQSCITCVDICEKEKGTACQYCICLSLPITIFIDLITLIPSSFIYGINKCLKKK